MSQRIYLDNNNVAKPSDQIAAKMAPFISEHWGIPSTPHQIGQTTIPYVDEALKGLYALLGANENDEIIFTSSGAEAVNQVILSAYFDVTMHTGKNQFITSILDEAPSMMAIGRLEKLSCIGKMASPDKNGQITASAVADAMTPRTALVSLPWANGLTGVINPIEEIYALCKDRGVLLHLDASYVIGKIFFEWEELPAHFISFSGHHFHAPLGTGALFIRKDVKCSPLILGGMDQAGYRAGAYNLASLVGLGEAAREAMDACDFMSTEIARLRGKFESGILAAIPDAVVFFKEQFRLPNCSVIAFSGIANESLLYLLNRKGVYATIGGGGYQQIGLILSACGVDPILAHTALSFSLSKETSEDEIDRAIEIIVDCVSELRKISHEFFKLEG